MKTLKYPKLWQRLGVKALEKELLPCAPIVPGHKAGLGVCLTQGSEHAKAACPVCRRALGHGRLTAINLNPNLPRGHWRLMHLAHATQPFLFALTGSTHEASCRFCQDARLAMLPAIMIGWLKQGIIDAVHAYRDCAKALSAEPAPVAEQMSEEPVSDWESESASDEEIAA